MVNLKRKILFLFVCMAGVGSSLGLAVADGEISLSDHQILLLNLMGYIVHEEGSFTVHNTQQAVFDKRLAALSGNKHQYYIYNATKQCVVWAPHQQGSPCLEGEFPSLNYKALMSQKNDVNRLPVVSHYESKDQGMSYEVLSSAFSFKEPGDKPVEDYLLVLAIAN